MRPRIGFPTLLLLFMLICVAPVRAAEILAYLPKNVLGIVLVRDVRTTNTRIGKIVDIFENGLPAPLEMAQTMTGLSEGLNLEGDLLFALLPAADPAGVPAPMFLLPVADYPKLAEAIRGDATGEICRVTLAGEDVLVAKRDEYALLMNLEHRELIQQCLESATAVPDEFTDFHNWILKNNISAMVTARGISHLERLAEEQRKAALSSLGTQPFSEPTIATSILHVSDSLPFAELFIRKTEMAGIGVVIDEATNARVRWKVKFDRADADAATRAIDEKPFVGFADKPYVLAGGGDLPVEFSTVLADFFTSLSRTSAAQDGRAEFTESDWADVRKSYDLWLSGLNSVSLLLTPGKEGEPMLSIFFARLTVDDAKSYLESLKKSFDLSNDLTARSTSDIKLHFEISPVKIANAEGIEVSCDLGKATGDGDLHIWQAFLTSLVGVDHTLSLYFCATNENQVFFAMEAQEKLAAFIEAYRKQDTGLAANAQTKKTIELLAKDSPWTCLVNPQGFVELVRTAMKSMQILGFVPEFPLYPTAPPLGMTLSAEQTTWQGEMVMPVEAARAMAQFTKAVEAAFR